MTQIIFKRESDEKELFRIALNGTMLLTATGGERIVWETTSTSGSLGPGDTVLVRANKETINWRQRRTPMESMN